ncbi:uncharacterized protein LOC8283850 [Ricinus communis]|uniref:Uncharacterized protein n=1 Tax=Ricinus communis TaxID=3988 RepID=B9SGU0_RICCO|nr:uncharacterized protein LOC8283850 [Ricinus communis]EEF37175.1 conserved hypothetical protein [Ricinus communis]|eukprot:XP_002525209.1 uncharacterized protein LOC8283850 [Ricinus communis]
MTATAKEDKRWSGDAKKMEGDDSLRTLHCLRGRLLAERHASKVAKEEADLMGNKLLEIETKLREETKLRQKADRKLKFLLKKLESLKLSPALEGVEVLSNSSDSSCLSFSDTSSSKDPEESASKSQASQEMKEINHSSESATTRDSLDSNSLPNFKDSLSDKSIYHFTPSCQDSKKDSQSCSDLEAAGVVEMRKDSTSESDKEENVDNSLALALVPVNLAATNKTSELMIVNKSVGEVLDALRHAREKIQSSIERRHMSRVRVGPS